MALAGKQRRRSDNRERNGAVPRGVVVTYSVGDSDPASHEAVTRTGIAMKLAKLKGFAFAGEYDPRARYGGPVYFVPRDTLVGIAEARTLGIRGADDLFGGVVPHRFAATKAITHPLFDQRSRAPAGWVAEFPCAVASSSLEGFCAFSREDARRAGTSLLDHGPIRVKLTTGIGGVGQYVVTTPGELAAVLGDIDAEEICTSGLVIEENLDDITTYSVGQASVAGLVATYWGTQQVTCNNRGVQVYGGSDLLVARGDIDALSRFPMTDAVRLAIAQARAYDAAAASCFPGFYASRRNYDVIQGVDARGRRRSGVLEQSWRLGGASGAEIGALEAFRAEPHLTTVRAVTVETYGEGPPPPADAAIYFRGVDARVGPLTKYSRVEYGANLRRAR